MSGRRASITNINSHRASSIASAQWEDATKTSTTASGFVQAARQVLYFQITGLQAQLSLINSLSSMDDDEKRKLLFSLFDKDGDGLIQTVELADGLRKLDGELNFETSLLAAMATMAKFDTSEDTALDEDEFKVFLDTMLQELGCTFHDLAELLITKVVISTNHNSRFEERLAREISDDVDAQVMEVEQTLKASIDKRMRALFILFDADGNGVVDFKEIAKGLYKLIGDMNLGPVISSALFALLLFDDGDIEPLDYESFCCLITDFCAAAGKKFDEVADGLLMAACNPLPEDPVDVLKTTEDAVGEVSEKEKSKLSGRDSRKLSILFNMMSDDKGKVEINMGSLKSSMKASMGQTTLSPEDIKAIEEDAPPEDTSMTRDEFATFLINLAEENNADPAQYVHVMLITVANHSNDEYGADYLAVINEDDVLNALTELEIANEDDEEEEDGEKNEEEDGEKNE